MSSAVSERRRPPRVSHNLFFALQPGDEVRARIDAAAHRLKEEHPSSGRWIKPHRYHLTLRYLGAHARLPDELIAAALSSGDRLRVPAFEFALETAGSFANRTIPWWIGCRDMPPGLGALWDAISTGLDKHGLRAAGEERIPHVTVLRDADRLLPSMPVAPIAWPVEEFALVDSLLGPEPMHKVLHRWCLSG